MISWTILIASSVFPQTLEVEHVYAYTESGTAVLTFDNGGFEERGGSLAHWSTLGNTPNFGTNNVRGDTQHVLSGDASLKVYGQFNGAENVSGVQQGISVSAGQELLAEVSTFVSANDSIVGTNN